MFWRFAPTRNVIGPAPGLAEWWPLCTVCVTSCAGVRKGRLESFMQSGYRTISDMSHVSLLLSKEVGAAAFAATGSCPR